MQAVTKNDVIRIYWTRVEVANTLAYYDMATNVAIKNVLYYRHQKKMDKQYNKGIFDTKMI